MAPMKLSDVYKNNKINKYQFQPLYVLMLQIKVLNNSNIYIICRVMN